MWSSFWGTTILSLVTPPVAAEAFSFTTSRPSRAIVASLLYLLAWLCVLPTLLEGVLPVVMHQYAPLQISQLLWAASHACLLVRLGSCSSRCTAAFLAAGSSTASISSSTKLQIVHTSLVQVDGCLDWRSPTELSFALPLMCATSSCTLLTLVMNLLILEEALYLPRLMSATASATTLLSGQMRSGCSDSLMRSYSASMPVANASASTSHGDHLDTLSGSLREWNLTGSFSPSLMA